MGGDASTSVRFRGVPKSSSCMEMTSYGTLKSGTTVVPSRPSLSVHVMQSERRHKHQGQDAKCRRVELYPPTIPLWGCHSAPCSSSKFDQHHYTGAKAEAVAMQMQMQQHSPASSYAETDCADSDSDDSGCGDCQCRLEA
ncbi:hypothetical protein PF002_g26872 [Phytophthora fragariae]|uniref:Uncharacterized protein n=1 Tax=Phytophthora fragariae TaxID=53985 RepID=A0A6A3WMX9_9STRA|nr:hypothetical protein PF002_g26872 [Phytophthora fragariae]